MNARPQIILYKGQLFQVDFGLPYLFGTTIPYTHCQMISIDFIGVR